MKGVSDTVMKKLMDHSWHGNVRELRNVIRRSVLLTKGEMINTIHIPDEIRFVTQESATNTSSITEIKNDMEKEIILKAIKDAGGNKTKAAKILDMNERTFYRKIKNLGIS